MTSVSRASISTINAQNETLNQLEQSGDLNAVDLNKLRRKSTLQSQSIQQQQQQQVNQMFHDNQAADQRKMRRVIAEDLEWNLMTIPTLSELCTRTIVKNFSTNPLHDELPLKMRKKVLQQIPVDSIPLKLGSKLIDDEGYWERCCKAKWRVNDVSKYGMSWKRMFFERELKSLIETFIPNKSDLIKLNEILLLGAPYIVKLDVKQLLPPVELEKSDFNLDAEQNQINENDENDSAYDNDKDEEVSL
jgi:hypothetical protein